MATISRTIEQLTTVAESVGSDRFRTAVLELARSVMPHDSYLALRYFQDDWPKIIAEGGLVDGLMDIYTGGVYRDDPFYTTWVNSSAEGVLVLTQIEPDQNQPYFERYLWPRAGITDEVGILLPENGASTLGIFVEKSKGSYSHKELERLATLYPLIANLNRSHLNHLVWNIRSVAEQESGTHHLSLLVVDDAGRRIFADGDWLDGDTDSEADDALRTMRSSNRITILLHDGRLIRRINLDGKSQFSDAVEAYLMIPTGGDVVPNIQSCNSGEIWSNFTPRESEIVRLVLKGFPNALIAERLSLSLGTVKNYRSRLYYKLDISTERELILLLSGQ